VPAVLRGASPSRLIEAATDLARRGGDLPALQLLAAALQASPRHPQGHLLRLELLRRVGPERDLAAWLSSLRALYERAEATPSMVLELALVEERLGETTSALDHYHEVLALGALRAAALPLVELAQAGVQRCEQLVAAAAAAAEAARPRAPAPASRKSRKAEASPARPVAEASRAPAEPLPPRAEAVLTGRASMQLPVERPVVPVEVPVVCQFVPAPELETRLFAGPPDPFPVYQNAQELWGFGPELLATSPGQLGLSLPRPVPSPPPDTAWRSGPRPLARLADRLAALAGGRALICAADDDQGAACQVLFMLPERGDHQTAHVGRQHVLPANLHHTRAAPLSQGQYRSEIQVVREHSVSIGLGPIHDRSVGGLGIAHRRPVGCRPMGILEQRNPVWRQVHVDQDLEAHGSGNATSRSSTRQAA